MGNSIPTELNQTLKLSPPERKSHFSQMRHIYQAGPFPCDKKLLSDMSEQHVYTSNTHTRKYQEGGDGVRKVRGGRYFSHWRLPLFCLSVHAHLQTSAIWIQLRKWTVILFISSIHCKVTPVPSPILSHTHLKYLLHTRSVSTCQLVCVCVWGDFVLQESEKDPLPVSNCLSHSTLSLNPPRSGYFFLFLAPSLFLHLSMGGFVSYRSHKTLIHSMS